MAATRLTKAMDERTRLAKVRLGQRVLDKWRLERLLGLGEMAAVFEAVHRNGNRVAIKILHADLAGFDEVRERFLAEGYAANRISHPGVVTVRDEGTTDDGSVFLVMDLLRGQTLAERLNAAHEPFSVGEVLEIGSQLLDVLVVAHSRGVVHGDIKPASVLLTHDRRVKLLDFGIARGHLAELDGRHDLWSLGATLHLLLTGAALPGSVIAVVERALAFHPEDRFPDARSMQLAVRAAQNELRGPDSRATLPPASVEPVALSQCAPRADDGYQRPSVHTVRPVAASMTAPPTAKTTASALSVYVSLGVAVGLGIVIAARFTLQAPPAMTALQPEPPSSAKASAPAAAELESPSSAPPSSASPAPAVSASISALRVSGRPPARSITK